VLDICRVFQPKKNHYTKNQKINGGTQPIAFTVRARHTYVPARKQSIIWYGVEVQGFAISTRKKNNKSAGSTSLPAFFTPPTALCIYTPWFW